MKKLVNSRLFEAAAYESREAHGKLRYGSDAGWGAGSLARGSASQTAFGG
jgi:hypothetical protein